MDPRREKKCIKKNSTNHNFFEPWANKFYAHLQKKLFKKLSKFYDFFFLDQSWTFGLMLSNKCLIHL